MVELSTIIKEVRIVLDHNEVTNEILGLDSEDQLALDTIIEHQVETAARMTILLAPREYVDWCILTEGAGRESDGCYAVKLPQDFLRFGAAKMSGWAKAIDTYSGVESDAYARQQSEFAGVRATSRKPVAIMVENAMTIDNDTETAVGGNEIQLYPCNENDELQYLTYAKQPKVVKNSTTQKDEMSITDTLYQPFIYMTAAMVAEVLKDTEKSNEMMAGAKAMLTNPDKIQQAVDNGQ